MRLFWRESGLVVATLFAVSVGAAQDHAARATQVGPAYRYARGQQLGALLSRSFVDLRTLSASIEVGAFGTIGRPASIALAFPGKDVDNRHARFVAVVDLAGSVGRRWYVSARVGATIVHWGEGTWSPGASTVGQRDPAGTSTLAVHGGVGGGHAFDVGARSYRFEVDAARTFDAIEPYMAIRVRLVRTL